MRRLSGWTRLWIVCAVLIWLLGAGWTLTQVGVPPPGPNASDADVCRYVWRANGYPTDMESLRWLRRCEHAPLIADGARQRALGDAPAYWMNAGGYAAVWLVAPFLLASAWAVGRWVQRGFQPKPN